MKNIQAYNGLIILVCVLLAVKLWETISGTWETRLNFNYITYVVSKKGF